MHVQKINMPKEIMNEEYLNGIVYGIIDLDSKIAVIPDNYVTWIMKVKKIHDSDSLLPIYKATKIISLFTNSQFIVT